MCVRSVTQLCLTLCNPMASSPPGFSVHEIFQARILEWVSISYSREKYEIVQSFLENNLEVSLIVKHIPSIYSATLLEDKKEYICLQILYRNFQSQSNFICNDQSLEQSKWWLTGK